MGVREGNRIKERLASLVPGKEFLMRVNAGTAWVGKVVKEIRTQSGKFTTLKNCRPFHGVQKGVSDMIGFEVVEITAEMVGDKVAVFLAEEVKVTGVLTKEQQAFGDFVESHGGIFRILY